jgi:uncharacterized protein
MLSFIKISLLFFFLIISPFLKAQDMVESVPPKPAYPRMYNDENAYAYYHSYWRKLEDKLINHQKRTGNQLVFVVLSSLNGLSIEDMALQIFRQWGVGNKEANTGLLVLIARKEQQIKIETGYGLEGQVTDLASGDIIRNILLPALSAFEFQLPPAKKDKGYLPGIEKTIDTLIQLTAEINKEALQHAAIHKKRNASNRKIQLLVYAASAIFLFIVARVGWRVLNNKLSKKTE